MPPTLGRLARVDLRTHWKREDTDFTPWLAQDDNLALLGDAVGLDLAKEDVEVGVGPFRADILAKDTATGAYVLIENQLERTDHAHLGQILTYAAGLEAVTIIWVAEKFTEEHRAALDWLNRVTEENLSFFGVEVELWRIGDSVAAPKFNLVSKPNDWAKSVAEVAHHGEGTPAQERNRAYWTAFMARLETTKSPLAVRKAPPDNWVSWSLGRSGFILWARLTSPAVVAVCLQGKDAAQRYAALLAQREAIEAELGEKLEWQTEPKKQWYVKLPRSKESDPDDRASWPELQAWMQSRVEKLDKVFRPRVKAVPEEFAPGGTFDAV